MALSGCPFCRELFPAGETETCPHCGVRVEPLHALPPSYEARVARAEELSAIPPEDRPVSWLYPGRGRGPLFLSSVLGLALFFAPWISLHKPDEITLTGFELARSRGMWFFGGAVGWFVTLPLVVSRRTVRSMRGVRVITATFTVLSVIIPGFLLLNPPRGNHFFPVEFEWESGLYGTLITGVLATFFATRFGGRADDIRASELLPVRDAELVRDADDEVMH